jgi:hypothetical protein
MSREKKFDATFKRLVDVRSPQWVPYICRRLNLPPDAKAIAVDADLSTVSAQADKIFSLSDGKDGYLHLEAQVSRDDELPDRTLLYSVLFENKFKGPIYSVVLLLRREADASTMTGVLKRLRADGTSYLTFGYAVIRVWELRCDDLLAAGLGMFPLAMVTDDAQDRLQELMQRVEQEIQRENLSPKAAGEFWIHCFGMLGVRYNRPFIQQLFQGVKGMMESSTFQGIFEDGQAKTLATWRASLRKLAEKRFGALSKKNEKRLNEINDEDRLGRMNERMFEATNWDDLLNTP